MSIKIATTRQQELIGRAYEVVSIAHLHGIPIRLFTDWSKEVERFLEQGRTAPAWLARKTDFDLISEWFTDLVNAMNTGKTVLGRDGSLSSRWTINGFVREIRAHRNQLSTQCVKHLLDEIAAMRQAGENAGVNKNTMIWWEKEMDERFCESEQLFSNLEEKHSGLLDSKIKDRKDCDTVMSGFNRLLVEINETKNKRGNEAVVQLFSSQEFEPEQIYHRLFSKPIESLDHVLDLLSDPAPSPSASRRSSSVFSVGRR